MQESVKKDREKYIGGSDIPIIMEISPFKTRFDLLLEKAGYKEDSFDGNLYTEYGNIMEEKIRNHINQMTGMEFKEGKHTKAIPASWGKAMSKQMKIRAHTDGETKEKILEIKTTSQIHDDLSGYRVYLVQILFYMMVTGKKEGILAIYERPDDFSEDFDEKRLTVYQEEITLEKYADECANIIRAVSRFLEDLEKVKSNPFITEDELLPAEIPEIASRVIEFEQQLALMKELDQKIKTEKTRLRDAMEKAGVKSWETPNGYKITLVESKPDTAVTEKQFNAERFMKDHPDLVKKYTEKKTVIKSGKAGYVKITAPKEKK